jgi:hypothetical protein
MSGQVLRTRFLSAAALSGADDKTAASPALHAAADDGPDHNSYRIGGTS